MGAFRELLVQFARMQKSSAASTARAAGWMNGKWKRIWVLCQKLFLSQCDGKVYASKI